MIHIPDRFRGEPPKKSFFEKHALATATVLATVGVGYAIFLCWLAFINWHAAIFLLLLALVYNRAYKKNSDE